METTMTTTTETTACPATETVICNPMDTLKVELAEVMIQVEVRKQFYKRALASLTAVYNLEKQARAALKADKGNAEKADDLAEVIEMVAARKKFYARAMKSLQSIYVLENGIRAKIKDLRASKRQPVAELAA